MVRYGTKLYTQILNDNTSKGKLEGKIILLCNAKLQQRDFEFWIRSKINICRCLAWLADDVK